MTRIMVRAMTRVNPTRHQEVVRRAVLSSRSPFSVRGLAGKALPIYRLPRRVHLDRDARAVSESGTTCSCRTIRGLRRWCHALLAALRGGLAHEVPGGAHATGAPEALHHQIPSTRSSPSSR